MQTADKQRTVRGGGVLCLPNSVCGAFAQLSALACA